MNRRTITSLLCNSSVRSIALSLGMSVLLLLVGMVVVLAQPDQEIAEASSVWVTVNRIPRLAALLFLLVYGVPVALYRAWTTPRTERDISQIDIVVFDLIAAAIIAASVAFELVVFGEQPPIFLAVCTPAFWIGVVGAVIVAAIIVIVLLRNGERIGASVVAPSTITVVPASRGGGVFRQATLAVTLSSFTDDADHAPMKPIVVNAITYQEDSTLPFTTLQNDQTTIVPDSTGGATINGIVQGRFLPGKSTIRINVTVKCGEDDTATADLDVPVN